MLVCLAQESRPEHGLFVFPSKGGGRYRRATVNCDRMRPTKIERLSQSGESIFSGSASHSMEFW